MIGEGGGDTHRLVTMSDNIIKPNFGSPKNDGGGGEPPKPPTYEELMFQVEQQREIIQHLRNMLLTREDEYKRVNEALVLAQRQLKVLIDFCGQGAAIMQDMAKNFKVTESILPKR